MLALPPLRSRGDAEYLLGEMEDFSSGNRDQFLDFPEGNLLDCINFDDIFAGIDDDGDVLPDLEMVDPEILADFAAGASGSEESEVNASAAAEKVDDESSKDLAESSTDRDESVEVKVTASIKEGSRKGGKKSTGVQSKNNIGKRKVKVDWTPELHRKFVQAVEQLGLDKAVPSKILELMGIDCLTRHNIASHLQKYRSQRKHMQAREVEAANWSQRRQMYGSTAVASKRVVAAGPWLSGVAPTMAFPPMAPPPPIQHHQFPRPLHVWGHPTVDRQFPWPKPMVHSPPPPRQPLWPVAPAYPLPPPPPDPCSYWHPHQHQGFSTAPVPGIPPPTMYKDEHSNTIPNSQSSPRLPIDFHPSNESIDAAIGDALTKPWQPLPLGLRPPSLDSVLMELHRQGIPKIPPFSA